MHQKWGDNKLKVCRSIQWSLVLHYYVLRMQCARLNAIGKFLLYNIWPKWWFPWTHCCHLSSFSGQGKRGEDLPGVFVDLEQAGSLEKRYLMEFKFKITNLLSPTPISAMVTSRIKGNWNILKHRGKEKRGQLVGTLILINNPSYCWMGKLSGKQVTPLYLKSSMLSLSTLP